MDNLFRDKSKYIRIYLAVETEIDPYEHTVESTMLNPLPVKAIVSDLNFSSIQWKIPGIITDKAKEIIIKKKRENLLKRSHKIEINGELYNGWRINGRLQYRIEGNYLRAYVYSKKES